MEEETVKVIVFPGRKSLEKLSVEELTNLRIQVMQYEDIIAMIIREKIQI